MENTATTEGNGKRYDAATGVTLGPASAPPLRTTGRNIDGFFRPRATTIPRAEAAPAIEHSIASLAAKPSAPEIRDVVAIRSKAKPKQPSAARSVNHTQAHAPQAPKSRAIRIDHTTAQAQSLTVRRGQPNHVHHHAVQRSQTLRRDTVPAPELSTHNNLRPAGALQHKEPSLIELKNSADNVDLDRLARASSVEKSPLVARHIPTAPPILPTLTPVAVQPTPVPTPQPSIPSPVPGNGTMPPTPAPQTDNKPGDIFEHALASANHYVDVQAHKAQYKKKARMHLLSMTTGSLALIIVATFVAYQNSPVMQFKAASLKAGISTHMPNFAAAGFSYNGVRAGDDRLTFGFKGDSGSYQLTQTATNFDDNDMIQTIGATNPNGTPMYQVVQAGNTTVYRFSNTNATWVSNGNWYTVSGDTALSNQQVKNIVQHA